MSFGEAIECALRESGLFQSALESQNVVDPNGEHVHVLPRLSKQKLLTATASELVANDFTYSGMDGQHPVYSDGTWSVTVRECGNIIATVDNESRLGCLRVGDFVKMKTLPPPPPTHLVNTNNNSTLEIGPDVFTEFNSGSRVGETFNKCLFLSLAAAVLKKFDDRDLIESLHELGVDPVEAYAAYLILLLCPGFDAQTDANTMGGEEHIQGFVYMFGCKVTLIKLNRFKEKEDGCYKILSVQEFSRPDVNSDEMIYLVLQGGHYQFAVKI